MKTLMQNIQRFVRDEEGAVAIEYGLLASLVALGIIVGATALGDKLDGMFTFISNKFPQA